MFQIVLISSLILVFQLSVFNGLGVICNSGVPEGNLRVFKNVEQEGENLG